MVPLKSHNRKVKKRNKPKQVWRRKVRRNTTSNSATSWLIKGARTLIGLLSGQSLLQSVTDFMFGSAKAVSAIYKRIAGGFDPTSNQFAHGLQSVLDIDVGNVIADAMLATTNNGGNWMLKFSEAFIMTITVTVVSVGPTENCSGMMSMALEPRPYITVTGNALPYRIVREKTLSKIDSAAQPMSMSFTPTVCYLEAFRMFPVECSFLRVFIAREDLRDGSNYTSKDYQCNVNVTGSVKLCCRNVNATSYSRTTVYYATNYITTCDGKLLVSGEDGVYTSYLERHQMSIPPTDVFDGGFVDPKSPME